MRVLALTSLYPNPLQPHLANHNRRMLRHLARRNDVVVIAPVAWTEELAARRRGERLPPGRRAELDGLDVRHPRYLFTPRALRGWYGKFFRWSVRAEFARAVADFRPDLVYAPWAYPDGWAAVRLGHAAGLPVVVHAMGSDVLRADRTPGRLRGTVDAVRRADAVVAVSRDLAGRLLGLGVEPARVRVVYRGVDAELFRPGPRREARGRLGLPPDSRLVLFVGGLEPVKGPEVLIEACGLLAARGTPFTCVLVGRGSLRQKLESLAGDRGIADRVRFLGPVANDRLPDWYRAANVVVLPSLSEGVPNVLLEAAACGTPFVASRVGGIPEIAHLGPSELVPAGDAARLADALAASLDAGDPPAGGRAAPRGWDEAAAELTAVFEEVLARRRTAPAPGPGTGARST
jgi:glycosyltransferase involved in cell wall biosynthesis